GLTMGLSGCIEIVEEITINEDGSGKISFGVDLGVLGQMLGGKSGDNVKGKIADEMKKLPRVLAEKLTGNKGITNIVPTIDNDKGVFKISFFFKDSDNLNKSIYKIAGKEYNSLMPDVIKIKKHRARMRNMVPLIKYYLNKNAEKDADEKIYTMVSFRTTVHFPYKVRHISNRRAILSDEEKTATLKYTLAEIRKGEVSTGFHARFR
ncbi:MAG: hypothetical protein V2A54_12435, partial [Bacteroidota bacterium]